MKKKGNFLFNLVVFLIGLGLSVFLFYLDYIVIGPEVTFTLAYLIPIVLVVWFAGRNWGILLSLICVVEWFIAKTSQHTLYYDNLLVMNTILKSSVYVFVVLLLTRLKTLLERESEISRKDFLTGALNRKGLYEALEQELNRAKRNSYSIAVAYIDVDNFKGVNDTHGHFAGDKLLVSLADAIMTHIRSTDIFARIGGDEFILVFSKADMETAKKILGNINSTVELDLKKHKWNASLSVGTGVFNHPDQDIEKLLNLTDGLMYEIKSSTKKGMLFREF